MKNLILFVLCLLAAQHSEAQTPSNCTPAGALTGAYDADVSSLALQRIYQLRSPDTARIEVPAAYRDTILQGMAAVYNLDTALQANQVFDVYCIHEMPRGFAKRVLKVKVDTSYAWAKEWAQLHSVTGNAPLDRFLSIHGFSVTGYYCASNQDYLNNVATLTTTHTLNCDAFWDSLRRFSGVQYRQEYYGSAGDGSHIYYTKDSVRRYTFVFAWDDCPSGCLNTKDWTYEVDDRCQVRFSFAEHAMTPNPAFPPYCNLSHTAAENLKPKKAIAVYPNPADEMLHLAAGSDVSAKPFTLTDASGRMVRQGMLYDDATVDLHGVSAGIYLLIIKEADGTAHRERIVKR